MRYKAALTDFCGVQKFFELVMTYITYTTRLGLGLEGREAREFMTGFMIDGHTIEKGKRVYILVILCHSSDLTLHQR